MAGTFARGPLRRTICRYCGVETDTNGSHSSERECVEALAAEVTKTRRLLCDTRNPVSPGLPASRRPGG